MTMDLYVHITDDFKKEEMLKLESEMSQIGITEEVVEKWYTQASKMVAFDGVKMA